MSYLPRLGMQQPPAAPSHFPPARCASARWTGRAFTISSSPTKAPVHTDTSRPVSTPGWRNSITIPFNENQLERFSILFPIPSNATLAA
jgi:hypothetical protein